MKVHWRLSAVLKQASKNFVGMIGDGSQAAAHRVSECVIGWASPVQQQAGMALENSRLRPSVLRDGLRPVLERLRDENAFLCDISHINEDFSDLIKRFISMCLVAVRFFRFGRPPQALNDSKKLFYLT